MAMSVITQALGVAISSWVSWNVIRWILSAPPFSEIPGPEPESLLVGNIRQMLGSDAQKYQLWLTEKFGRICKIHGPLKTSILFVSDTKALHQILIKDAQIWPRTVDGVRSQRLMFGPGLISVTGAQHDHQRKMLSPVFSAARIREMTPTFYEVAYKLVDSLVEILGTEEREIDILPWMTRTALEVIGRGGFGYSFDTMEPNAPQHPFAKSLKNLFRASQTTGILIARNTLVPCVYPGTSGRFRRFFVDAASQFWTGLRELRDMVDVMEKTSIEIVEATKDAVLSGKDLSTRAGRGKDLMSLLVRANMSASKESQISDEELYASVSTITFGAMDTTSNTLCSILHLLTIHVEWQEKLRRELTDAFHEHGRDLDYDALHALPVLDAVVKETLRLWPASPFLARQVTADTVLPLGTPLTGANGKKISEIFVPKDGLVFMSLLSCNRDPKVWGPDAAEWKPERWLVPLPSSVAEAHIPAVFSHVMTFGGGGQSCIGYKFAHLEIKVVLAILLQTLSFSPSGKKIRWQQNGFTQPTTDEAPTLPSGHKQLEFPVKVALVST